VTEADPTGLFLANDLFFVMHDDRTGRIRLHPRLIGLGLAAAILSELMLPGRITVEKAAGNVQLRLIDTTPTGDALTQTTLDHIVNEPAHPFRTWLHFLARTARADVAGRMTDAGMLRRPTMRVRRHVPVDPDTAILPVARLNLSIQRREPFVTASGVLLGLVIATGAAPLVLWDQDPEYMAGAVASLPAPFKELIAQTEAAVGAAVLSRS
jgi:hypothetical protein